MGYLGNVILEPHKYTDPISLIKQAKEIKNQLQNDEVWVVYDAESPQQRNPSSEHSPAWQGAIDSGIKVAISSISYETWILLHYDYTTRVFNNSDALEKHIKDKHQNDYDKSDMNIFPKLKNKLATARKHAKSLGNHNNKVNPDKKPYEMNPYTDFHKLLNAMDKFVKNN